MEEKFSSLGEQPNSVKDTWVTSTLLLTIAGAGFFTYLPREAAGAAPVAAPSSLWGVSQTQNRHTWILVSSEEFSSLCRLEVREKLQPCFPSTLSPGCLIPGVTQSRGEHTTPHCRGSLPLARVQAPASPGEQWGPCCAWRAAAKVSRLLAGPKAAAEQPTSIGDTASSFHCHLLLLLPLGTTLPLAIREVERDEGTFLGNRATDAVIPSSSSPCEPQSFSPFQYQAALPAHKGMGSFLPHCLCLLCHNPAWPSPTAQPGLHSLLQAPETLVTQKMLDASEPLLVLWRASGVMQFRSEPEQNPVDKWHHTKIFRTSAFPHPHCQPQSLHASHTCHPLHWGCSCCSWKCFLQLNCTLLK